MRLHSDLFSAIEDTEKNCDADGCTCETGWAIGALLAVIWIHCPAEWHDAIMRAQALRDPGMCVACGVRYPCRNIVAIAEEYGLGKRARGLKR